MVHLEAARLVDPAGRRRWTRPPAGTPWSHRARRPTRAVTAAPRCPGPVPRWSGSRPERRRRRPSRRGTRRDRGPARRRRSSRTVAKVTSPASRTARAGSPYRAARSSVASQPSSSDRVVPRRSTTWLRTEPPQHLGHRARASAGSARRSTSRPPRSAVRLGPSGWTWARGGSERAAYHSATRATASSSGHPGVARARAPSCRARRTRPRRAAATRPSGSLSTGCQPGSASRSACHGVEAAVHATVGAAPACPRRCRRWRSRRGRPPRGVRRRPAVVPGLADAEHVGHRRAARRAGLARQHAAYDDPLADHVRAERQERVPRVDPRAGLQWATVGY